MRKGNGKRLVLGRRPGKEQSLVTLATCQLEDYISQLPLQLDVTREEVLCGNLEAVP